MPTAKFTVFINAAVQENSPERTGTAAAAPATTRVGGISESWYSSLSWNSAELFAVVNEYARLRAKLLPNVCAIVARRYQEVGSRGKVILSKKTTSGSADTIADIPQMALRVRSHSRTTGAERFFVIGAIPDARVSRGSYLPSTEFQNNLNALLAFIKANCLMRAIDQTPATFPINAIGANGNLTTFKPTTLVLNDVVQVMASRDNKYRAQGGYFKIIDWTDASTFKLENWTGGACVDGKIRKHVVGYEQLDFYDADYTNPQATTRKFGRPFDLFRGRA